MISSMRMAVWLRLAASPCFACMAVLVAHETPAGLRSAAPGGLPVSGMSAMYLLMGLFHLSPWLALVASRSGTQC
jgi:hypothetical protein